MRNASLIMIILLLGLIPAIVANPTPTPGSYCIDNTACYANLPQEVCESVPDRYYYDAQSSYPQNGFTDWQAVIDGCQIVTCHNPTLNFCENLNFNFCTSPNTVVPEGEACPGIPICQEGQEGQEGQDGPDGPEGTCLCGNNPNPIGPGQFCCGGSIEDQACSGGPTDPGEGEGDIPVCGDGIWSSSLGEVCDESAGSGIGLCPPHATQSCLAGCRCQYLPSYEDYGCDNLGGCVELECTEDFPININSPPPTVNAINGAPTPSIRITWDPGDECAEQNADIRIYITSMDRDRHDLTIDQNILAQDPPVFSYEINDLVPGVEYEIQIFAREQGNPSNNDNYITTHLVPEARCQVNPTDSWCLDETAYYDCAQPPEDTACTGGRVCLDGTNGGHECVSNGIDCESCNKGYGDFGEVIDTEATVTIEGFGAPTCETLASGFSFGGDAEVRVCYLDAESSALRTYQNCAEVVSCSEYTSRATCGDNPCNVQGNCEYNEVIDGLFVCVSEDTGTGSCENFDEATCPQIPYCHWDPAEGGSCQNNEQTCLDLTRSDLPLAQAQEACYGSNPFTIDTDTYDVIYSSDSEDDPNDILTKCVYVESQNRCLKNANGDTVYELDSDFSSPFTTITYDGSIDETGIYPTSVEVVASFNEPVRYFGYKLYTNQNCANTPRMRGELTRKEFIEGAVLEWTIPLNDEYPQLPEGNHCLVYYARDENSNVEPLQKRPLTVGQNAPGQVQLTSFSTDVLEILEITNIDGEQELVSNVLLRFSTSELATCTLDLAPAGNFQNGQSQPISQQGGQNFGTVLVQLPDYSPYTATITCDDQAPFEDRTFTVDSDGRIYGPIPDQVLVDDAPPFLVGIHTISHALCQVDIAGGSGTWRSLQKESIGDGQYRHRISGSQMPSQTGFYSLPVQCEFLPEDELPADNYVQGGPGDRISYVVDATPPLPTVTLPEDNFTIIFDSSRTATLPRREQTTQLQIICIDQPITGGNNNWEDPNPSLVGAPSDATIAPGETIQFHCEDNQDNVGSTYSISAPALDEAGPDYVVFRVVD